jgi:hypothetical protein
MVWPLTTGLTGVLRCEERRDDAYETEEAAAVETTAVASKDDTSGALS